MLSPSERLKQAGLKVTKARLSVLCVFDQTTARHLSADQVYRCLNDCGDKIAVATVYRVLSQLEAAELLIKHYFEADHAVFELNSRFHHDHLVCRDCGHIEEFCDPEIERLQHNIAQEKGFSLSSHVLCLYANCQRPDCPRKQSPQTLLDNPS